MAHGMTNLRGFSNTLRHMLPGGSSTLKCPPDERRPLQLRITAHIGAFKRGGAYGWRRYSTAIVADGVKVTRNLDAI